MSRSLDALKKQLTWKIKDAVLHLHTKEEECLKLNDKIKELNKKLSESYSKTRLINPDLEITRLNYTLQVQEEIRKTSIVLKEEEELKFHQQQKLQRLKTELKMIELYLTKQQQQTLKDETKKHDHLMDEWALKDKELA